MKNQITQEQAATIKPSDMARICNTLLIAGDMLAQIADGKNFPARVYMENLHAIRTVVFDIMPSNGQ
jgi:hypothetical protein